MFPMNYDNVNDDDQVEFETSTKPLLNDTAVVVLDSMCRPSHLAVAFAFFVSMLMWAIVSSLSNFNARSCTQPQIRREWRSLSSMERDEYIQAVKCLSTIPSSICNGTLHDEFAEIHRKIGDYSHEAAPFLPWHRYFIHIYEETLKQRCQYRGNLPYWDWTRDWTDITESPVFHSATGFGGNGEVNEIDPIGHGGCVQDGPFANLQLQYYDTDWYPHCLSRGFLTKELSRSVSTQRLNHSIMSHVLDESDYYSFLLKLEEGPHSAIPIIIRGDFSRFTAPNDPLFFLHHGQIDRLWWNWQNQDRHARTRFYNGPASHNSSRRASLSDVINMSSLATSISVKTAMTTKNDIFCYKYED